MSGGPDQVFGVDFSGARDDEEWQATYAVETLEKLEQSLANGDLASDELRGRRDVIAFWREKEEDRRLIKHAWHSTPTSKPLANK